MGRLTLPEREQLKRRIEAVLGRMRFTAPFPMEMTQATEYKQVLSFVPPAIAESVLALHELGAKNWMNMARAMHISIHIPGEPEPVLVALNMSTNYPLPDEWMGDNLFHMTPEHPHAVAIWQWVSEARAIDKRIAHAIKFAAYKIIDKVNTPGQIQRVAPSIAHVLSSTVQKSIGKAKIASPWPAGVSRQYIEDNQDEATTTILMASMLEPHDGRTHFTPKPDVWLT